MGFESAERPPRIEEPPLRVAEVLAALSLTTDLAAGMTFEKGLRACAVATRFAQDLTGSDPILRRTVFETALLRSVGCISYAPELAALFGDDVAVQAALKTLDPGDEAVLAGQLAGFGAWAGADAPRQPQSAGGGRVETHRHRTNIGQHRLGRPAVAVVAEPRWAESPFSYPQMLGQFRVQCPVEHSLGQLPQQPVRSQ